MIISRTDIEWATHVWNPAHGCKRQCPYCYARKMHRRFCEPVDFNTPHLHDKNFKKDFPKKPSIIFVNSMSDIEFWKPIWFHLVLDKIRWYPQHKFIFLTKDLTCKAYREYSWPDNCYLGLTLTGKEDTLPGGPIDINWHNPILNFEPLITFNDYLEYQVNIEHPLKQIIIGLMTGKKEIPKPSETEIHDFVDNVVKFESCKLFIKDNVYRHYPDLKRVQERV